MFNYFEKMEERVVVKKQRFFKHYKNIFDTSKYININSIEDLDIALDKFYNRCQDFLIKNPKLNEMPILKEEKYLCIYDETIKCASSGGLLPIPGKFTYMGLLDLKETVFTYNPYN